jgi:hypothetical protein
MDESTTGLGDFKAVFMLLNIALRREEVREIYRIYVIRKLKKETDND